MAELGAEDQDGILFHIGKELYPPYKDLSPITVAKTAWSRWPISRRGPSAPSANGASLTSPVAVAK